MGPRPARLQPLDGAGARSRDSQRAGSFDPCASLPARDIRARTLSSPGPGSLASRAPRLAGRVRRPARERRNWARDRPQRQLPQPARDPLREPRDARGLRGQPEVPDLAPPVARAGPKPRSRAGHGHLGRASSTERWRAHLDDIDYDHGRGAYEKQLRHDVMAHVHALRRAVARIARADRPPGRDQLLRRRQHGHCWSSAMRTGRWCCAKPGRASSTQLARSRRVRLGRDQPTLRFTHYQPAQLTTFGKPRCACGSAGPALIDLENLRDADASAA